MVCPKCKTPMIWGSDFNYEDYGAEGQGVVGSYTCNNNRCDVDAVDIFTPIEI